MSVSVWPSEFPRLETKRLVLRQLTADDVPALFRNYSDPAVTAFFMAQPFVEVSQAEDLITAFAEEFTEQHAITWAVSPVAGGECIGTCSLMLRTTSTAELGYDLATQWWGQGLMTEALRTVLAFAFRELGLGVIAADTSSTNVRSVGLLERLGFHLDEERDGRCYFSLRAG